MVSKIVFSRADILNEWSPSLPFLIKLELFDNKRFIVNDNNMRSYSEKELESLRQNFDLHKRVFPLLLSSIGKALHTASGKRECFRFIKYQPV